MRAAARDKRREGRFLAEGSVRVRLTDPPPSHIDGQLVDISAHGFRMRHTCAVLAAGQVVEFSYASATGQARVVWNRVMPDRVESGFVVV